MTNINTHRKVANSTYAVLVRSEQEERSAVESAVYLLFVLSAVFSIWQVAHQPITLPVDTATQRAAIAQSVSGQHQGV
ncbi:MAG TPA: hypothetical protein VK993_15270 [Chthoniobacterales bacterium]|nr:hypothetical protein [Chthoniobacterales bacterium]